jgi:predicted N-acetyltransferase YhbS
LLIGLLEDAASWLHANGVAQWVTPFPVDVVRADIDRGAAWLAWRGGMAVGTVALSDADPLLWGDRSDPAWYVHRLVTDRRNPGTGRTILTWVEDEAARRGIPRIRLDCGPGLRSYYERLGYTRWADLSLVAPRTSPPRLELSCYEKVLA